jgi:pimeloyl-ACP methyl ester carboxylesterase
MVIRGNEAARGAVMNEGSATDPGVSLDYDEFAFLDNFATRIGLGEQRERDVERRSVALASGQRVSGLFWGGREPEMVLVHGFAQNAHSYDGVAMALGRPSFSMDLPGHGHSDWRDDHDYGPMTSADTVAETIERCAPNLKLLVGMSMGGTTSIHLAATHRGLIPRLVLVDITPRVGPPPMSAARRDVSELMRGPALFESFDDMVAAVRRATPGREHDSEPIGLRHNARQRSDGRWTWRYDRERRVNTTPRWEADGRQLWDDLASLDIPLMLVMGGESSHVREEDLEHFSDLQPSARIEIVPDAGHSVQIDQPMRLTELLLEFLEETASESTSA